MGYTYEFTWVLRLPSEELPDESSSSTQDALVWKRTHGNIILGYNRQGGRMYPVGMTVLIITRSEKAIGIGSIHKCEIHALPNGQQMTLVEFTVKRMFNAQEVEIVSRVFREMYGYGEGGSS